MDLKKLLPALVFSILVVLILSNCAKDKGPYTWDICDCDSTIFRDCYCDSLDMQRPDPCLCDTTQMRDCYCDTLDPKPNCDCDTTQWRDCDCDTWDLPQDCPCDTSAYHDCWCDVYQPDTCRCDTTDFHDCDCDPYDPPKPKIVSYKNDIQPIWNQHCIACHWEFGSYHPDLTSEYSYGDIQYFNYLDLDNPASSTIYRIVTGATGMPMPPAPTDLIPVEKQQLILLWIQQGAKNN